MGEDDALPFIVVEPSRIQDNINNGEEERLILPLQQQFQARMVEQAAIYAAKENEDGDDERVEEGEENTNTPQATITSARKITTGDFWQEPSPFDKDDDNQQLIDPTYLRELFSFAAVVSLIPENSPGDMRTVLKMTNTLERLQFLDQGLEEGRWN